MTSAGSVAGLAAIVGVAVMLALYIRQSRQVNRLREWAGTAPERSRPAGLPRPVSMPHRRWGVVAAAATSIAVVLVAGYLIARPASKSPGSRAAALAPRIDDVADLPRARRRDTPVAVLNGSSVAGLAQRTARRLVALGFRQDVIADAPRRTRRAAQVAYADADASPAAAAIANMLHAGRPAPVESAARALARHAEVIVTVGVAQQ